jgi:hypothetical protein
MLSFKCCSASLSMLLAFGNPKYLTCWFAINRNPYTISFSIHETSLLLLQIPCRPKTYRGRYKFTFPPFLWILFDNAWAGTGNDIPKDPWAILELPVKLVDKWSSKGHTIVSLHFAISNVSSSNGILQFNCLPTDEIVRYKTSLICSISTYYELFNEPWLSQQKPTREKPVQPPNSVRIIVLRSPPSNNW